MDPELFLEMANQVTKLRMYPYFDVAHCVVTCLYVREDLAAGECGRRRGTRAALDARPDGDWR